MADPIGVMTFDAAIDRAKKADARISVLLGNGFSIGAYDGFRYQTLYEEACKEGLSDRVKGVFEHYGTANFEDILRRLDEGVWLAEHYELWDSSAPTMQHDHEGVKNALTSVIARVHPASKFDVDAGKLEACSEFLGLFGDAFTTNYDLLVYWALLAKEPYPFQDAFFEEGGDDYRVFVAPTSNGKRLHYLHGALHIYTRDGEVRKRQWDGRGPLMEKVREGLDKGEYPLIVTEGSAADKRAAVEASGYLSWCHQAFAAIDGTLVVIGSSFADQDEHIWKAIVEDRYLTRLAVGVNGDGTSASSRDVIARAVKLTERRHALSLFRPIFPELRLAIFDARTAPVWAKAQKAP